MGERHRASRSGEPHAAARGLGGPEQFTLHVDECDARSAEGDEPFDRIRARSERRGPEQKCLLQFALAVVEQRLHETGAGSEAPEDRSLTDTRFRCDGVHRDRVGAVLGDEQGRGVEQTLPIASRVAAFCGVVIDQPQRVSVHKITF